MQLDPGAVAQIARTYHGYYRVDAGGHGHVLRYDNDFQEDGGSSLEINCKQGIILIKLRTPQRGKTEVEKQNADYNILHQVFKDPRCFFLPPVVKAKRRSSRELSGESKEDSGPQVFTLSAYKNPVKQTPINGIIGSGLLVPGGGSLDLGAPFPGGVGIDLGAPLQGCGVAGGLGLRVPTPKTTIGPRVPCEEVTPAKQRKVESTVSEKKIVKLPSEESGDKKEEEEFVENIKIIGPAKPDPTLLPPEGVDHELKTVDQLYRTKTRTELNYLKRKQELDRERLKRRAELSHKDKIEVYNTYLSNLPEFNEQRKINWSKH